MLDDGHGEAEALSAVKDGNGRGPLHFAARGGCDEICKFIVDDLKLPVDVRDNDGTSLLVFALAFSILFCDVCVISEQDFIMAMYSIFTNVSV